MIDDFAKQTIIIISHEVIIKYLYIINDDV